MAKLQLGIIGLGKMGMQIARRLHKKGYRVVAWNRSEEPRNRFKRFTLSSSPPKSGERNNRRGGASVVVVTILKLIETLPKQKIIWTMLPAGKPSAGAMEILLKNLKRGDIVIDGANENYQVTVKRAKIFARRGIAFFDAGTSGGVHGEKKGFSIMVGGPKKSWPIIRPIIKDLAAGDSCGLVGKSGSGQFVKMVHNGIEYGMMEAIAEGYAVINKWDPTIDLAQVAKIWQEGSVISSWLIDLSRDIFEKEDMKKVVGFVEHTGEGMWTVEAARRLGVDTRVIEASLDVRNESKNKKHQKLLRNKILALFRNRFGGHEVIRK